MRLQNPKDVGLYAECKEKMWRTSAEDGLVEGSSSGSHNGDVMSNQEAIHARANI